MTTGATGTSLLATFGRRLGEISGTHACSPLTLAFRLVLEAQRAGEPVVWISGTESIFFPPDASDAGVDLAALPVVRAVEERAAARTADRLTRSGAFGLVILDLGSGANLPIPFQTRLMGLARKHHAALVCLTEKDDRRPSLGSLVSLRLDAARTELASRPGESPPVPANLDDAGCARLPRYRCEARALKDKLRQPGWKHVEVCRGPDGLC